MTTFTEMRAKQKGAIRAMRAKIHIAKKELGMDDFAYRSLLLTTVGANSAKGLNRSEMDKVLAEFKRLGWKPKRARKANKATTRKIFAIWYQLSDAGHVNRNGCRAFVKRMTDKDDPDFLTDKEASRVIEALKGWDKRKSETSK